MNEESNEGARTPWPKSGPTVRQQVAEARRVAAGGEVDWAKVPTERQEEQWAILHDAEDLHGRASSVRESLEDDEELTSSEARMAVRGLAGLLEELASLFHAHLKVVDLDDESKAIGVGPAADLRANGRGYMPAIEALAALGVDVPQSEWAAVAAEFLALAREGGYDPAADPNNPGYDPDADPSNQGRPGR